MNLSTPERTFPDTQLKEWFLSFGRPLPWRDNPTPYSVWISEIMLQQTQAQVVIDYFEKWMKEFPSIEDLAQAPIEKVLKIWEGLGYYSRARNLHEAANEIVRKYGGKIPNQKEALAQIKGIGPYTQGAILSFAFHQKAPAVDGNVLRLLSRYFAIQDPIDEPKTRKFFEELTFSLLPDESSWIVMEGMIELGAVICKKKPNCSLCPIRSNCLAYRHTLQQEIPVKRKKQQTTFLERIVAVIQHEGKYLIQKGEKGKVMEDLYEFPYCEKTDLAKAIPYFEEMCGGTLSLVQELPLQQHTFTRFRVKLLPLLFMSKNRDLKGIWKNYQEMEELPFSSGHRRILKNLEVL